MPTPKGSPRRTLYRSARASLLAPLLAPSGVSAFAVFLWARTGTPFATYQADSYGWHNGLINVLRQPLTGQLAHHPADAASYLGNPSLWNGVGGTVFLAFALLALHRHRRELTAGAMAFTGGIGAVTLWSVMTLPGARMLLIAFPSVVIWARRLSRRQFPVFLTAEALLLLFTSALTLADLMLP